MRKLENWNRQIRFEVPEDLYKTPEDIAEVQAIVRKANESDKNVTVVGAMHSTTECMVGTGYVVSMKLMNRVLSIDKVNKLVTVEAGVTLHQLCAELKDAGLQPPVILELGNFQIGAISGTHANDTSVTRKDQFSSFVAGVKMVTPNGEIREISESQNPEELPFIRSHFGLFGVVCEVTLRVFENKPLRITFKRTDLDHFVQAFNEEIQELPRSIVWDDLPL